MNYILLISSVALGGLIGYLLRSSKQLNVKHLLTFSGAYLLGISVFHILPEVYEGHNHSIGLWVMVGFFVQLLLEVFSKGIEHGHNHSADFSKSSLPFGILIALYLHAFLESMPIGGHTEDLGRKALLWGIVIHKLPVSIILFSMLREFSTKWYVIFFWMLLFAAMGPLGMISSDYLGLVEEYFRELSAFVFGIFLHISTTILFESNKSHRFNVAKFSIIILASALAWMSVAH